MKTADKFRLPNSPGFNPREIFVVKAIYGNEVVCHLDKEAKFDPKLRMTMIFPDITVNTVEMVDSSDCEAARLAHYQNLERQSRKLAA